ncbi:MAG: Ig-like domain-containing protein [Haloarculaceae archaeon]
MYRDDDRGQSVQIGAVLLFGALVVALAGYQAFVVPQQNERVEFSHSQTVQDDMQELRNALVSATGEVSTRSVSVTLGTRYPDRLFAVNPGPVSGSLRTAGTADSSVTLRVVNARTDGETGDFWTGATRSYPTGFVTYRPDYNRYRNAPTTVYEHSALVSDFGTGTVALADPSFVDGRRITLVALNGSLSTTRVGASSVDVRPVSASTRTVSVTNTSGSNVTIELPTRFSESFWQEALSDQLAPDGYVESVDVVSGSPSDTLVVELTAGENYTLRLAKAGVGTGVEGTEAAYLTDVAGNGSAVPEAGSERLVLEVRDEYNNPVSGVVVYANATDGTFTDKKVTTDSNGRAVFQYEAPGSVDALREATVEFSYEGVPGADFDGTAPENVTMTVDVQNTRTDASGSGSVPYAVTWHSPDGGSDSRYKLDVGAEGTTKTLTALVENSTLGNRTIDGADVDFAVNDSTVGTVSPGTDTSGPAGKVSTTFTAEDNGVVRVYVTADGGASDYLDINVTGMNTPSISNVALGESGGDLTLSFDSSEALGSDTSDISVTVDGPNTNDVYSFDRTDFSETNNGDGTFTYTLTTTQAYDDGAGTYTATVDDAVDIAGNNGGENGEGSGLSDTYSYSSGPPTTQNGIRYDGGLTSTGSSSAIQFDISNVDSSSARIEGIRVSVQNGVDDQIYNDGPREFEITGGDSDGYRDRDGNPTANSFAADGSTIALTQNGVLSTSGSGSSATVSVGQFGTASGNTFTEYDFGSLTRVSSSDNWDVKVVLELQNRGDVTFYFDES